MSNNDETEPFLARWSRRKRGLPDDKPSSTASSDAAAANSAPPSQAQPADDGAEKTSESGPPLDLSKLPRLEDLTADTDITAFLDQRVPASLRNAVLNRMWTLDPTIRDFIEVAELQWDWNTPGGAPFYEVMEPGSAAGTIIADASSALSRAIRGEVEPPTVETATPAPAADETPRKIEQSTPEHLAAQHSPTPDPQSSLASAPHPAEPDRGSAPDRAPDAAPQQAAARPLPQYRRHGGALPT